METFVVRIWAPADAAERTSAATSLRGRLEHVASGRGVPFNGTDELARLIERELRRVDRHAGEAGKKEG